MIDRENYNRDCNSCICLSCCNSDCFVSMCSGVKLEPEYYSEKLIENCYCEDCKGFLNDEAEC